MRIPDSLYALGFEFKKSKIWKTIFEEEVFGVRLKNGETGYCVVMGRNGEHFALACYVGEKGLNSYLTLLKCDEDPRSVDIFVQDCVQCSLETKELLTDDELTGLKRYALKKGLHFSGPHPYIQFSRYYPYCIPWYELSEDDIDNLSRALEAALALQQLLKKQSKQELGLYSLDYDEQVIPVLTKKNDGYSISYEPIPKRNPKVYQDVPFHDDVLLQELKRQKKRCSLQMEMIHTALPLQEKDEIPFFPCAMVLVRKSDGHLYPAAMWPGRDGDNTDAPFEVAKALIQEGIYPRTIEVRKDETAALLRDLCRQADIKLRMFPELPSLEQGIQIVDYAVSQMENEGIFEDEDWEIDDEQIAEIEAMLTAMTDREIKNIPDQEFIDFIMDLGADGLLSQGLYTRLKKILR